MTERTEQGTTEKRSSTEWLETPEFAGVVIMDPDGWDRRDLAASMAEPVTLTEFRQRLARSTHWPRNTKA